jgi:pyridoxamine 5'-phosphate oxidase
MKSLTPPERWSSLEKIWAEAWRMLVVAVSDSKNPLRTPVLGTVGTEGGHLRTVVLRQVVEAERLIMFNTDVRSSKVRDIQSQPRLSWLFYHPQERVQLRLAGQTSLLQVGSLLDEEWNRLSSLNRRDYCTVDPPGSPLTRPSSGLPDNFGPTPTPAEAEIGRKNFVVVVCQVDFLDWLLLQEAGHLRAQFTWQDHKLSATWVVP